MKNGSEKKEEIDRVRAARLERARVILEDRFSGKKSLFARATEISPAQCHQIFGSKNTPPLRPVGDLLARKFERKLGLPPYFLDGQPNSQGPGKEVPSAPSERRLAIGVLLRSPEGRVYMCSDVGQRTILGIDLEKHPQAPLLGREQWVGIEEILYNPDAMSSL